jgi:hypothetical protein
MSLFLREFDAMPSRLAFLTAIMCVTIGCPLRLVICAPAAHSALESDRSDSLPSGSCFVALATSTAQPAGTKPVCMMVFLVPGGMVSDWRLTESVDASLRMATCRSLHSQQVLLRI